MKLLALAALPACDVVFGIAAVPPALEVNHGDVTIDYTWTTATQTPSGPLIATNVTAPDGYLDVRAELLDGTKLQVARPSPTRYTFTLPPGASYVVRLQARDAATATEIETAAATMNLVDYVLDRADAVGAAQPLPISYTPSYATVTTSADYAALVSLGARAQVAFDINTPDAPQLGDWRTAISSSNVHGPLLSTAQFHDHLVLERWTFDGTIQWVTDALVDDVEMTDGTPLVRGTAGTPIAVPELELDRCVELDARRMTLIQQLVDLTGWTVSPQTGWNISSTPSFDAPPGNLLAVAGNYDGTADQVRDVNYGRPFPGEAQIGVLGANVQQPIAVPGTAAPTNLYAGISLMSALPPSTPSTCVPVSFTMAGIATAASIAGQPLTVAGQTVTIDSSHRVPFDVTIAGGAWDDVRVALLEAVDDNGTTALRRIAAYQISSDPPTASIDPTQLVEGHYYILEFNTRLGFPKAHELDLSVVQYPFANTVGYSKLFKIGN